MCTESHWFSIRVDILSKGDECFPIELYHPHEFTPPWRRDSCERRTKKRSWHPHSFSSFFIGFLWCGRLFWLSVVCTFAFFVVQISYGQWVRYQQHPTMISLETNYGNWMYLYPAVTMCSNYTNADTTIDVVQRWVWTTAEQNVIYFFVTPERQTDVRKKKFDEMHPTTCSCTVCGTFQPTTMHLPCTKRSRSPLQPPPGRI